MIKILSLVSSLTFSCISYAQTPFFSDSFEGASATGGTRTWTFNSGSGGPPNTRYFKQTTLGNINAPTYTGTGLDGTQCWAAEDNDGALNGVSGGIAEEQNVTWTGIDISGRNGITFSGLFATGSTAGWDHGTATANADYARVQYNIDNAGWVTFLDFRPTNMNATNGRLAVDGNQDGLGEGTQLTTSFVEFTATISATGNTMQLRVEVRSNTLAEEFAFDNISLAPASTMPVTLIDFSSEPVKAGNKLSWSTASEQNSRFFQVERSTDGIGFETIGRVNAAGTSTTIQHYTFLDNYTTAGKIYYRLNQVDLDGSAEYSKIISIRSSEQARVRLYPNPVADKLIVYPGNLIVTQAGIQIINSSGIQMPLAFTKKGGNYECNTESLRPGVYIVKINSESGVFSRIIKKK